MVCERCQHVNPDADRFCGKCGHSLVQEPVKVGAQETEYKAPVYYSAGPSILGLDADSPDETSYLLADDEPSPGGRRPIVLTILLLAALAGMGYFYWQHVYTPSAQLQVPPPHTVPAPAFAYEHTAPLALANAKLAVTMTQPALPDRSSYDRVRFQRIAADLQQEQAAADPRNNPHLVEGEKYLYGRGVAQNCTQAIEDFKEAAKQKNVLALTHLGVMSASGRCMKRDRVEAYNWFARAKEADPENLWLERSMDMLWANMSHRERSKILK